MRMIRAGLAALALTFLALPAAADVKSRTDISAEIATLFAGGSTGTITAAKLRQVAQDIADSYANLSSDLTGNSFASLDGNGHVLPAQMPGFSGSCSSAAGSTVLTCAGIASLASGTTSISGCTSGYFLYNNAGILGCSAASSSIAFPQAVTGGAAGSVAYFSSPTQLNHSAVLGAGQIMIGGGIGSGPSTITTGTGVTTALGSATTGTGGLVLATSPALVTPNLGTATATTINRLAITAPGTTATLAPTSGKTLAYQNTMTLAALDGATVTFQGSDTYVGRATTDTLLNKTIDTASGNTLKLSGKQISTISGNTTKLASVSGAFITGNCLKSDASGNLVDAAATCGTGGGGSSASIFDMSASSYGGCTTSSTDSGVCINAAMTACSAAGGGTVTVPAGRWNVTTQIVIPSGCQLVGLAPPVFNYTSSALNAGGSIIVVNWGSGANTSANAAILLRSAAGVRSLGFDYPTASGSAWGSTILIAGSGGNVDQFVTDCFFLKAYIAIDFRGSVSGVGMAGANIMNNRGATSHYGVALDFFVDFINVVNNHFNAGWSSTGQNALSPTDSNTIAAGSSGAAFFLGGGDGVNLINNQAWGYAVGVQIIGGSGYTGKGPYAINGGAYDRCGTGVLIGGNVSIVQVFSTWFVPIASGGVSGAAISVMSGVSFDAGVGSLLVNGNFMYAGTQLVWAAQGSQTLGSVIVTSNHMEGGASTNSVVITGNNKATYIGNAEFGYTGPNITGGTVDTGGGAGGGAGCTTTCSFSGTVTAANLTTGGAVTASGSITGTNYNNGSGIYGWGSNTGVYGVSGSTVGLEVGGAPLMSVSGFAMTLGSGVHGFQDGGGSWIATSDARTKRDIAAYPLGLDDLKTLRPVNFQYNGTHGTTDDGKRYTGLIAQEVLKTPFASMIGHHKGPDGEDVLDLDNSQLVYALVNAVVTLSGKVDKLSGERVAPRRRAH